MPSPPVRRSTPRASPARARSASPSVRPWSGPRRSPTPKRSPKRSPKRTGRVSRLTRGIVTALAFQGLLGKKVNAPRVEVTGRSLAPWPLGTSGYVHNLSKTYYHGGIKGMVPAVELRRVKTPKIRSRRMAPGGHLGIGYKAGVNWVAPPLTGGIIERKLMVGGRLPSIPKSRVTVNELVKYNKQGFYIPPRMIEQAIRGEPIIGNAQYPNWAKRKNLPPKLAAIVAKAQAPPTKRQLALPAPVARKISAMQRRARNAAVQTVSRGTAKAVAFPYQVAGAARNATGRAVKKTGNVIGQVTASGVGAYRKGRATLGYLVSLPGRAIAARKAHKKATAIRTGVY